MEREIKMQRKYRYENIRRLRYRRAPSFEVQNEDWFSDAVAWLGRHTLLVFGSILFCMMLLSIACDQVLGHVDAGNSVDAGDSVDTDNPSVTPPPSLSLVDGQLWWSDVDGDATQQGEALALVKYGLSDQTPPQTGTDDKFSFSQLFGEGQVGVMLNWRESIGTLAFRLTLAALLGALVCFRPLKSISYRPRNPYVVQTQILLTVVACALMMIVGDNAARAFGIFAAASLVRFRTSIRDPKETTILLVNLGIGLAAGVGRWELATIFALFVLVLLQILESYERRQTIRLMELSVKTHDVEATDEVVREIFRRNNVLVDLREFNKQSEKRPLGKIVYAVDIHPQLDTDRLAEALYLADPVNIARIEWHRKKAPSLAYGD